MSSGSARLEQWRAARSAPALPEGLADPLSCASLETAKAREGRLQFGTLGRGNHFAELQQDDAGQLWLMVHSGSRAMGPAIRQLHEAGADADAQGFKGLHHGSPRGLAYLHDLDWARRYARLNRERIAERACEVLVDVLNARPDAGEMGVLHCDHNHVCREVHGGRALWVHRKGAQRLDAGQLGIVPGSMGSPSYHVEGRGVAEALCSAAHGAGRALARGEARRRIKCRELDAQMRGVWFDARLRDALREEAPGAYKDIGEVMRAQRELVRVVRRLRPVLVYKAT
jgi:tRNA-splicing ligase RtcB